MSDIDHPGKKKPRWRGFPLQLFLLTILPLTVLLLVVVFGSQMLHHDAMRSLVADRDLRTVEGAAAALERELAYKADFILLFANNLEASTFTGVEELAAAFDGGVAVYAPDGVLLRPASGSPGWQQAHARFPETLETANMQSGEPVFSTLPAASADEEAFILAGVRNGAGETIVGAFSIGKMVSETLGSLSSSGQTSIWVLQPGLSGTQYDILYESNPSGAAKDMLADTVSRQIFNGESGIRHFESRTGEHLVAYSPVASAGIWLVMEEAWEDITSPFLSTTQTAPLILVPVFLLALVALWFGASRIVKPLQELEKQAVRLAGGDFEAIDRPVGGIEEIRSLQSELAGMAERVKTAQHSQRSYIGAITAGVENERRNLARELHDDTIQSLIALNQRIQLSLMDAAGDQRKELVALQKLVQDTMVGLRRLIRGLRPIYLEDLGLTASLRMLVQETVQAAGIPVSFELEGVEKRLDPQVEMSLYRMVQESLSNVARHSDAAQAEVKLSFSDRDLVIAVVDDGKGFAVPSSPSELPEKGHFGLLGLQERADILNADLSIASSPGDGTTITIHLCDLHEHALEEPSEAVSDQLS